MYVVSKVVLDVIPPFTLLLIRLLIGALILGLWALASEGIHLSRRDLLALLGVGMVGFGVSVGAQFVGTRLSTAANGALVTSASPAFIVLFAWLLLREPVTRLRLLALLLATAGVLIVVDPGRASFEAEMTWGNVALLIASLTWGLYSVLVKGQTARHSSLIVTLFAFVGGALVAGAVTPFELAIEGGMGNITPPVVLGILYLGVVSTAVAMYLWTKAFELLDAGVVSLSFFAQPVVGALLGWLLLEETLGRNFFVGGALILIGVGLVSVPQAQPSGGEACSE
jgi:drug/metabolite transporter (DMT)-like permease